MKAVISRKVDETNRLGSPYFKWVGRPDRLAARGFIKFNNRRKRQDFLK